MTMQYRYRFFNAPVSLKMAVWNKGRIIPGRDPNTWRQDSCGHLIRYSDHGNTNSTYGWEIDHIFPASRGGTDDLDNLQPLYWENNRIKGDQYPWYCQNAV